MSENEGKRVCISIQWSRTWVSIIWMNFSYKSQVYTIEADTHISSINAKWFVIVIENVWFGCTSSQVVNMKWVAVMCSLFVKILANDWCQISVSAQWNVLHYIYSIFMIVLHFLEREFNVTCISWKNAKSIQGRL